MTAEDMDIREVINEKSKGALLHSDEFECECGMTSFRYLGDSGFMCEECGRDYAYDLETDTFRKL
jgi:hypothetical protein